MISCLVCKSTRSQLDKVSRDDRVGREAREGGCNVSTSRDKNLLKSKWVEQIPACLSGAALRGDFEDGEPGAGAKCCRPSSHRSHVPGDLSQRGR
jgi:hypothetical protein